IAEDVREVRNPFEEKIFKNQNAVEEEALKLYKKDPKKAQEYLTNYSNGLMNDVTQMFLELRNQIITDYTNNHE
ncbi:MAG: peptidase, partial [Bacteroidota bacterium]